MANETDRTGLRNESAGSHAPSLERYGFRIGQAGRYATDSHWYEFPSNDPAVLEVWAYTDRISYAPGEDVKFHVYCTAATFSMDIVRDGHFPETVHEVADLPGSMPSTPDNAYEIGAGWPVAYVWRIPDGQRSGPYVVTTRIEKSAGESREHHHLFVVRPAPDPPQRAALLMIFATSTWIAYNEWGGANAYQGVAGEDHKSFSPRLSIHRPWHRGCVRLPEGAPHATHERNIPPGWAVDIPFFSWSMGNGYSKWYVGGSYAEYDSLLSRWAEKQGYRLDYITQHDLHFATVPLDKYQAVVIAGHDEYWSTAMRDAIDKFIDNGGRLARFGGNFFWQIRLEEDGATQVSYKTVAHEQDPVRDDPGQKHLLTCVWDDLVLDRPGVLTMGLNGTRGLYARMGAMAPRHSGGFTVYRPDHWVFEGTDLYYGDVFGAEAGIFGFEVDGLSYTFRDGLPYPTGEDGAPVDKIEILAMAPAVTMESDHGNPLSNVWWLDEDAIVVAKALYGDDSPESLSKVRYSSGMVVHYRRGKGEVINAGSCMWVQGLKRRDIFTEMITHNVLMRFGNPHS